MRSPLKILLRVARLPKNAVRAFVTRANESCSSKRSDTGEPRSPRVRGKTPGERLKNIKTAIDIAHAAKRQDDIYAAHMDRLV
jgi:hypothetical protein